MESINLWSDQAEDAELFRRLYIIELSGDMAYEIEGGEVNLVEVPNRYLSILENDTSATRIFPG